MRTSHRIWSFKAISLIEKPLVSIVPSTTPTVMTRSLRTVIRRLKAITPKNGLQKLKLSPMDTALRGKPNRIPHLVS
jgi:hypothetical protein